MNAKLEYFNNVVSVESVIGKIFVKKSRDFPAHSVFPESLCFAGMIVRAFEEKYSLKWAELMSVEYVQSLY